MEINFQSGMHLNKLYEKDCLHILQNFVIYKTLHFVTVQFATSAQFAISLSHTHTLTHTHSQTSKTKGVS